MRRAVLFGLIVLVGGIWFVARASNYSRRWPQHQRLVFGINVIAGLIACGFGIAWIAAAL